MQQRLSDRFEPQADIGYRTASIGERGEQAIAAGREYDCCLILGKLRTQTLQLLSLGQSRKGREQFVGVYRLGQVIVHACRQIPFSVTWVGVCRQRADRNI